MHRYGYEIKAFYLPLMEAMLSNNMCANLHVSIVKCVETITHSWKGWKRSWWEEREQKMHVNKTFRLSVMSQVMNLTCYIEQQWDDYNHPNIPAALFNKKAICEKKQWIWREGGNG